MKSFYMLPNLVNSSSSNPLGPNEAVLALFFKFLFFLISLTISFFVIILLMKGLLGERVKKYTNLIVHDHPFYLYLFLFSSLLASFLNYFSFTLNFSFLNMFKLIILLLLIIIHSYLVYLELNLFKSKNIVPECLQAGPIDYNVGKVIKNLFLSLGTIASLYSGHVALKQDNAANLAANKQISSLEGEIQNLKSNVHNSAILSEDLKNRIVSTSGLLTSKIDTLKSLTDKSSNLKDKINEKLTAYEKETNGVALELKGKIFAELDILKKDDSYYTAQLRTSIDETRDIVSEIDDSNQILKREASIGINFTDFWDYIDALGPMEKIAFSFLLLNQIIISSVISIIYIFYGDYLLKKFNIEQKYPKLAKVIELRRKFQSYYLLISIGWIISSVLIESVFCILIILP